MTFTLDTAILCLLGWIAHWLANWGEAYKIKRTGLLAFIEDNPPAFWLSLICTVAIYLIGPGVLQTIGVTLPSADQYAMKLGFAFIAGFMADYVVYKWMAMVKKEQQ